MAQTESSAIDDYVRRAIAAAPPLRPDQKSKLRTLLTGALADPATDEASKSQRA
jgi:hypothetical protein